MKRLFKCITLICCEQMALKLKSDSSAFEQIEVFTKSLAVLETADPSPG